jgi:hypothetical protein
MASKKRKRGARKARGTRVQIVGKVFGVGRRGRRVTLGRFKTHAATSNVADFMTGARKRAAGRTRRAKAHKHPRRRHASHRRMHADHLFDRLFDMAKKRKHHGRAKAKKSRLSPQASCVQKVIRANKAKGIKLSLGEASKWCADMRKAGTKAATAVAKVPMSGSYEEYQRSCRGEFNRVLGSKIKDLEEKYCRAGWTRKGIRTQLETVAKSLAAA